MKKYQVTIHQKVKEYPEGTTYLEIAKEHQHEVENDILLVFVNGKLQELYKRLEKDCEIKFVTSADACGNLTYKRGVSFLLVKAIHDVLDHGKQHRVQIHFSLDKGYYYTISGNVNIDQTFLDKVKLFLQFVKNFLLFKTR